MDQGVDGLAGLDDLFPPYRNLLQVGELFLQVRREVARLKWSVADRTALVVVHLQCCVDERLALNAVSASGVRRQSLHLR